MIYDGEFPSIGISPFNRTIVELKCLILNTTMVVLLTFNRTIVELKCLILNTTMVVLLTFNRTIVELKLWKRLRMLN